MEILHSPCIPKCVEDVLIENRFDCENSNRNLEDHIVESFEDKSSKEVRNLTYILLRSVVISDHAWRLIISQIFQDLDSPYTDTMIYATRALVFVPLAVFLEHWIHCGDSDTIEKFSEMLNSKLSRVQNAAVQSLSEILIRLNTELSAKSMILDLLATGSPTSSREIEIEMRFKLQETWKILLNSAPCEATVAISQLYALANFQRYACEGMLPTNCCSRVVTLLASYTHALPGWFLEFGISTMLLILTQLFNISMTFVDDEALATEYFIHQQLTQLSGFSRTSLKFFSTGIDLVGLEHIRIENTRLILVDHISNTPDRLSVCAMRYPYLSLKMLHGGESQVYDYLMGIFNVVERDELKALEEVVFLWPQLQVSILNALSHIILHAIQNKRLHKAERCIKVASSFISIVEFKERGDDILISGYLNLVRILYAIGNHPTCAIDLLRNYVPDARPSVIMEQAWVSAICFRLTHTHYTLPEKQFPMHSCELEGVALLNILHDLDTQTLKDAFAHAPWSTRMLHRSDANLSLFSSIRSCIGSKTHITKSRRQVKRPENYVLWPSSSHGTSDTIALSVVQMSTKPGIIVLMLGIRSAAMGNDTIGYVVSFASSRHFIHQRYSISLSLKGPASFLNWSKKWMDQSEPQSHCMTRTIRASSFGAVRICVALWSEKMDLQYRSCVYNVDPGWLIKEVGIPMQDRTKVFQSEWNRGTERLRIDFELSSSLSVYEVLKIETHESIVTLGNVFQSNTYMQISLLTSTCWDEIITIVITAFFTELDLSYGVIEIRSSSESLSELRDGTQRWVSSWIGKSFKVL